MCDRSPALMEVGGGEEGEEGKDRLGPDSVACVDAPWQISLGVQWFVSESLFSAVLGNC